MALNTSNRKTKGTMFLYAAALIVLTISIASLVNHILYFNTIVTQYVAQGYPLEEIMKQLLPSQFLPGLFQSVALYMGVAAALFGLGMVNHKLTLLTAPAVEMVNEALVEEVASDAAPEHVDSVEETIEVTEEEKVSN